MRRFTVKPALTLRGREFRGLRGFSGKPLHPPLTDFPIAAYILGAAFDVISIFGRHASWGPGFFHAGTYVFIGGAVVSLGSALTGFLDWLRTTEPGTQVRRSANTHAVIMLSVTALVIVDIVVRLATYRDAAPALGLVVLSVIVAGLVGLGASFGGSLVYDYGFNVEAAGNGPVWHRSEADIFPGEAPTVPAGLPLKGWASSFSTPGEPVGPVLGTPVAEAEHPALPAPEFDQDAPRTQELEVPGPSAAPESGHQAGDPAQATAGREGVRVRQRPPAG